MTVRESIASRDRAVVVPPWQQLGLRTKTALVAIALSVLPVLVAETIGYKHESDILKERVLHDQEAKTILLADGLSRFMGERYGDIQMLANLAILNNIQVAAQTSLQAKQATFNQFLKTHNTYDSVAFVALDGKPIVAAGIPAGDNYKDTEFFSAAIRTKAPVITPPRKSTVTGSYSIFLAAPVIETATGKIIGVVRTRIPAIKVEEPFQNNPLLRAREHFFVDDQGTIFAATNKEDVGVSAAQAFPAFASFVTQKKIDNTIANLHGTQLLASYAPMPQLTTGPDLNWSVLVAQNANVLSAGQQQLLLTYLGVAGVSAILVGAIAAFCSNLLIRPILNAATAVQKIGKGELDTRLRVRGKDELALLGDNINQLAEQIQTLLRRKDAETERVQLVKDITLQMTRSLKVDDILKAAVEGIRLAFQTDRVLVYRFDKNWNGTIVAESVTPMCPAAKNAQIDSSWFAKGYMEKYEQGQVLSIPNINEAGLTASQLAQLKPFSVQASLVAPILVNRQLLGLLIAHQCFKPRAWQQTEIDLFSQLAAQVGLAWERSHKQDKHQESFQIQLIDLLSNLERVVSGNTTVEADINAADTGAVTEYFNVLIEGLQQVLTQMRQSTVAVSTSIQEDEKKIRQLSEELAVQLEEIQRSFEAVKQMQSSLSTIALHASQAADVTQTALTTAKAEKILVDRTAEKALNLWEAVDNVDSKGKHLIELSQQISSIVSQLDRITEQTNILAVNAKLEADRMQNEGSGFATIAVGVNNLSTRTSVAHQELEQLARHLQKETSEIVQATELCTTEVLASTDLVGDTKKSLEQVLQVSSQIEQLVRSISTASTSQVQESQAVTDSILKLAKTAEESLNKSHQVSQSFQHTTEIAQQLQNLVGAFKAIS